MHKCTSCGHEWLRGAVFNLYSKNESYSFRECPNCSNKVKVKNRIRTKIKSRKEAVEYLNSGKCFQEAQEKYYNSNWHFGKCELRHLLDFIYGGLPRNKAEELVDIE